MKIQTKEDYLRNLKQSTGNFDLKTDKLVLEIIQEVREEGDQALLKYTEKFDKINLKSLAVTQEEILAAEDKLTAEFKEAMLEAYQNIEYFHKQQTEKSWFIEKEGIMLGQKVTALDRVGIYIPGGKAAYPSTVLMNAIPAHVAGVKEIVMVTPPQKDGSINPHVLFAAQLAGVTEIYKVGGAQAIAALAYGTQSIQAVDKITGPGNAFVARAKKWVYGDVAIDMIAGPSEICVLADKTANPEYIAADLLSQAEHDELARAICLTTDQSLAQEIKQEVARQLKALDRFEIANESIKNQSAIVVLDSLAEALELVNEIAPEHLQLMFENAEEALPSIKHAGAIFIGHYSPEALGDYFAGPNHTLPTSGTARFASPLGVYDIIKRSSLIRYSKDALLDGADHIIEIARKEGLEAHAKSIALRKDD